MISSTPRSTVWTTVIAGSRAAASWCSSILRTSPISACRTASCVDLVGHWAGDDHERRASGFRPVAYQTPRGCAAAYYPETNGLVPLDSTADGSNTPISKSVIISLVRPDPPVPRRSAAGRTRPGPTRATRAGRSPASSPSERDNVLGVSDSNDVTAARALLFDAFSRVRDGVVELTDGLDDATATYRARSRGQHHRVVDLAPDADRGREHRRPGRDRCGLAALARPVRAADRRRRHRLRDERRRRSAR